MVITSITQVWNNHRAFILKSSTMTILARSHTQGNDVPNFSVFPLVYLLLLPPSAYFLLRFSFPVTRCSFVHASWHFCLTFRFWVQRRLSLDSNQLSWDFLCRTSCHGSLSSKFRKMLQSALLKSRAVILLFILLLSFIILSFPISKAAVDLNMPCDAFTFCKYDVQQSLSLQWLFYQKGLEVVLNILQEPSVLIILHCVVLPADVKEVIIPWEPGPANVTLLLISKRFHSHNL